MIISLAGKQSIQPVVASSTAAAGSRPSKARSPRRGNPYCRCQKPVCDLLHQAARDNGEIRTHAHGVAVRRLTILATLSQRPRTDSNLHDAGLEDPCLHPFGDEDRYLQWDSRPSVARSPRRGNPRPLPPEGSALVQLSYADNTAGRTRTSSTASVVRRFIR